MYGFFGRKSNNNMSKKTISVVTDLSPNARRCDGMIEATVKAEEELQAVVSRGEGKAICVPDYVRQKRGM